MNKDLLPAYFNNASLTAIDKFNLEFYYEHFAVRNKMHYGLGHFALACYAALPAVLTPDLVHKLWLNFNEYKYNGETKMIHAVAPVDLLLSPLVEEIGPELYEMPELLRKALLGYLQEGPGAGILELQPLQAIAEFLYDYAKFDSSLLTANDRAFSEAQVWTALSYLDPGRAFSEVAKGIQDSQKTEAEKLRYRQAIEKMSGRFSLQIVRDPELLPEVFKGNSALTSVVRDVLQNRQPERLEAFKREVAGSSDELLTKEPLVRENVINIEIPAVVRAGIKDVQKKAGSTVRVLIVGLTSFSNTESDNEEITGAAILVEEMIDRFNLGAQVVSLIDSDVLLPNILESLHQMVQEAGPKDNLLFYICGMSAGSDGHCSFPFSRPGENRVGAELRDDQIGAILNLATCASITVIVDADHSGTKHWLDTSKPGRVIMASCLFSEENLKYYREMENCAFTKVIVEETGTEGTAYRRLFKRILLAYEKFTSERNKTVHVYEVLSPQFYCHPSMYNRRFLRANNDLFYLQSLLWQIGMADTSPTGFWDVLTSRELETFARQHELSNSLSKQQFILSLEEEKRRLLEKPVFLFIFSGWKSSSAMNEERQKILGVVNVHAAKYDISVMVLDNPNAAELNALMRDKSNRSKIQLVYFSGKDESGDMVLADGAYRLSDFIDLLEYQHNIQLFVSNTCSSQFYANYLVQMGIPMAIGTKGEVEEKFAGDWGIKLFENIFENGIVGPVDNMNEDKKGGYALNNYLLFTADQLQTTGPKWLQAKAQPAQKSEDDKPRYINYQDFIFLSPGDYVSREAELEFIDQYFKPGLPPIMIPGVAGVGKTTLLAMYVSIDKYADKYQHIAWINTGEDLYFDLYRAFTNSIEPEGKYEVRVEELQELLGQYDGNNLLIIEGVADEIVIDSLLAVLKSLKTSWHCIITPLVHIESTLVHTQILEGLSRDASKELFLEDFHKKVDDYGFDKLHEYCQGHPIMIKIIAEYGQHVKEVDSVYRALDHLRTKPLSEINEAVFNKYYYKYFISNFVEVDRDVLSYFSLMPPGKLHHLVIATLFNMAVAKVNEVCGRLYMSGLLEYSVGSYGMHPFIKEICLAGLKPTPKNTMVVIEQWIHMVSSEKDKNYKFLVSVGTSMYESFDKVDPKISDQVLGRLAHQVGLALYQTDQFLDSLQWLWNANRHLAFNKRFFELAVANMNLLLKTYQILNNRAQEEEDYVEGKTRHIPSLISAYQALGSIYRNNGAFLEAIGNYEKALNLAKEHFKIASAENWHPHQILAYSYKQLGYLEQDRSDFVAADRYFKQGVETIRASAVRFPSVLEIRMELAQLLKTLSQNAQRRNEMKLALEYAKEAVDIVGTAAESGQQRDYTQVVSAYENIAFIHRQLKQYEESRYFFETAYEIIERAINAEPSNLSLQLMLVANREHLGYLMREANDRDNANTAFKKSYEKIVELIKIYPNNRDYLIHYAVACQNLGSVEEFAENTALALTYYTEFNKIAQQLVDSHPQEEGDKSMLANSYTKLGLVTTGSTQESHYFAARTIYKELLANNPGNQSYKDSLTYVSGLLDNTQKRKK